MKNIIFFIICLIITACGKNGSTGVTAVSPGGSASNTHTFTLVITSTTSYAPVITTNQGAPDQGSLSPGPEGASNTFTITGRTANVQVTQIGAGSVSIQVLEDGQLQWTYNLTVTGSYTQRNFP